MSISRINGASQLHDSADLFLRALTPNTPSQLHELTSYLRYSEV